MALDQGDKEAILKHLRTRYDIIQMLMKQNEWEFDDFISHIRDTIVEIRIIMKKISEDTSMENFTGWIPFLRMGSFSYAMDMCLALAADFIRIGKKEGARDAFYTALVALQEVIVAVEDMN